MAKNFDFDKQAAAFDRRAGLPTEASRAIARAILETTAKPGAILDLGAGTGEVGCELASLNHHQPYVGIDLSLSMLGVFHHKLRGVVRTGTTLLRADAARPWPLRAGTISTFFFSRSAHLLEPEHLVTEMLRVARPSGAVLTVGRVHREQDSIRAQMRRRMRQSLSARGMEGKAGEAARKRLLVMVGERGGQGLEPRRVASWSRRERAGASLDSWSRKPGLAGLSLPAAQRREVLSEVEAWAKDRWGSLNTVHESTEHYELSIVHLPTAW
jgi:ubiquinone/menaquinone biosynthesis C-methylase UbiE